MTQNDAWTVKQMWNLGSSVGDIAYALDCSERTVRRCIDRNFEATTKRRQIADRVEKFFPDQGTGCFRAGVWRGDDGVTNAIEIHSFHSEPEAYVETMQEIDRRSEEIDSLVIERLFHSI